MEIKYINQDDKLYPKLLNNIEDKPNGIYLLGNQKVLNMSCISFVGTRKPSVYGEYSCQKIISEIADICSLCIVSGMARGIDTIAHKTALKHGLPTIAVLGSGFNHIYPKENIRLSKKIIKNGALITEFSKETPPKAMNFPLRNRIISGLSHATISIEAPEKSGTLITIKNALEQNRLCMCVPSDIDRESGIGNLKLLQKSEAYPVSSGKDVIDYLRENSFLFTEDLMQKEKKKKSIILKCPFENKIYSILKYGRGMGIVEICTKSGFDISTTLSNISKLEIKGLIKSKTGLYYKK